MTVIITIGLLVTGAVYLLLQRELLRIILGFVLLSHAANLVLIAAGGTSRRESPFGAPEDTSSVADPLPQAFVLTAIVIAFAITILLLVLSVSGKDADDTHDGAEGIPEFDDAPAADVDPGDAGGGIGQESQDAAFKEARP